MNINLSVSEWSRLAKEGHRIPVRIPLMGTSMFPLIRYNKDMVTVMPADSPLQAGDIVLFKDGRGLYVMHRIWRIQDRMVLTWGDHCPAPDNWITEEEVLGKAVLIERGKRVIRPDAKKGMRWAKFWHQAGKAYRLYRKYKDKWNDRMNERRENNHR